MIPASFAESNCVLNPPPGVSLEDCDVLSVFKGQNQNGHPVVISCWKLTPTESEELKRTGRVWLWCWGDTMPPAALATNSPFTQG